MINCRVSGRANERSAGYGGGKGKVAREQRSCRPARSRPPSGEDAGPTITDKIKKRKAAGGAEEWDASACGVASARRRFCLNQRRERKGATDRHCGSLSTWTARFTPRFHTSPCRSEKASALSTVLTTSTTLCKPQLCSFRHAFSYVERRDEPHGTRTCHAS